MSKADLQRIIDYYGADLQKQVAIEEMSELIKELCKDFRNLGDYGHILEELADVIIVIDELLLIYGVNENEISRMIDVKLMRTLLRIDEEKRRNKD